MSHGVALSQFLKTAPLEQVLPVLQKAKPHITWLGRDVVYVDGYEGTCSVAKIVKWYSAATERSINPSMTDIEGKIADRVEEIVDELDGQKSKAKNWLFMFIGIFTDYNETKDLCRLSVLSFSLPFARYKNHLEKSMGLRICVTHSDAN